MPKEPFLLLTGIALILGILEAPELLLRPADGQSQTGEAFFDCKGAVCTLYCKDTGCTTPLKDCQPAIMNLTRTNDVNNVTWVEYNSTGFDDQGNCKIYIDKYYSPKFGLIPGALVCPMPKEMLTVSNVSDLMEPSGPISSLCGPVHPLGLPTPGAPVNQTYMLKIGNQTFPIHYGFLDDSGTVENMTADPANKSVTVTIKDYYDNSSDKERLFSVEFPRVLFNANQSVTPPGCTETANGYCVSTVGLSDLPFTVLVRNNATYLGPHVGGDLSGNYTRIVSTSYPSGITEIQITGTNMVPEFNSSAFIEIAALPIGVVIVVRFKHYCEARQ